MGQRLPCDESERPVLDCAFRLAETRAAFPPAEIVDARRAPGQVDLDVETEPAVLLRLLGWLRQRSSVGPVAIKAVEHCLRCALATRPQANPPPDAGILHAIQQCNGIRVGEAGARRGSIRLFPS
jgi:hypothetical protein